MERECTKGERGLLGFYSVFSFARELRNCIDTSSKPCCSKEKPYSCQLAEVFTINSSEC